MNTFKNTPSNHGTGRKGRSIKRMTRQNQNPGSKVRNGSLTPRSTQSDPTTPHLYFIHHTSRVSHNLTIECLTLSTHLTSLSVVVSSSSSSFFISSHTNSSIKPPINNYLEHLVLPLSITRS